ncbi:NADH dehydrogenase [ubiquinone] 1 alpha subcomplex assembly factor 3 [Didymosphaeria variabile]|uniref:NADH dehydrogenase [ubiquinone] 1 alpha subcomplex assembly factor 3 n=1 Tax=Didymosphaeria variabile TaxID=1932322 RepID=A0A9W8XJF6_9PLEO|nr:NADH dehydrogenase [ubiquinone] 1 alpha subcomplex assembly factor 3 [Didymosphaeria variabile]KAJ4352109.1 NADH dehydrogenase [ubiquinone] 1 alpha subcomplex assembly factor 3 [Didymosphaeria variabile]
MASSRPRPQDPINGGWADASVSRPHSPPPYSSPPPERVDVDFAFGTMDQVSIDAFYFDNVTEEDSEEESVTSDVLAELDKLDEQLRIHRAPVVQPIAQQQPFPLMRLPLELREQVYDEYFRAEFILRDPYYPADPKPVPLELQRRFLHPFGDVKGLYDTDFEGCHEIAVSELRKAMAIPYPTVRESCELATTLMEEGDLLLATNNPQNALNAYIKSFDAIHIKISGRDRRILADGHFADDIHEGRYAGQAAMTVRVVLRIRLVARVIHAYIQLGLPNEAAFWGIRSIKLVRQGTPPSADMDDFFADFIGSSDIALMYAWTAAALTLMEEDEKWREEREGYKWEDGAWRTRGYVEEGGVVPCKREACVG